MAIEGTIGFLGYGNMGHAIVQGLIESSTTTADRILIYDVNSTRTADAAAHGIACALSREDLFDKSDVVVLAVKPQNMADALEELDSGATDKQLFVSIAAGVSIGYLKHLLGPSVRVARVMPNTPALVGCGAAGIAFGPECTKDDKGIVRTIFNAIGISETVSERQIDVVTSLSGSGPAYFFYLVECMARAAAKNGLKEEVATRLAAQTLIGAGKLLESSNESAAILRERVTSKGGTTDAALTSFEADAFGDIVEQAMNQAIARAEHLAQ